jgi:TonB-dependent starch-binding outer membrane protein SusC
MKNKPQWVEKTFSINFLPKILQIMKLTLVLIFLTAFQVFSANSYSQKTLLSIDKEGATVNEVLNQIENSSEFYFLFSPKLIDVERKVDLIAENQKIDNVLNQLFAGTNVKYVIMDRQIVLSTKELVNTLSIENQPLKITGTVTDNNGNPLPGVSIQIKGTQQGTVTDVNGKYSLEVPGSESVLAFSFIGYTAQEIVVGIQKIIDIAMVETSVTLEEVVVVGYGTQKKGELTSAIASVKSDNFVKGAVTDVAQLITGKIAGVGVVKPDANPLSEAQITLRGVTSLKAGAEPYVIIDGIPGSLSSVAPMDIESIDVLKDGSAAAIYGTRGSNGVILITTQKAKRDMPATIEVKSNVSVQAISKRLDFLNAEEYRNLVAQNKPGAVDYGASTNWLDEVIQTPVSQIYNVSLKGGNTNTNYIFNLNYEKLQGLIRRSDNNVFTPRLEVNHSMFNGKLRINGNIMGQEQNYFSGINPTVYRMALTYNPTDPIKDANGVWTEHPGVNNYANPVALLEETEGDAVNSGLKTFGSLNYSPINDLSLRLVASHNLTNSINGYSETKKHYSNVVNSKNGYASRSSNKGTDDLVELYGSYTKSINSHNIVALLGYSWQKNKYESFDESNFDFPSDLYSYNNMSTGLALKRGEGTMSSYKQETKLIGYFFRLNYNYKNRYMLMTSLRREGSSKFGEDHKWGNFPAVSVGWNIKNETFLNDAEFLSNFKIRAGFGVTGTEPTDPYMSQSRLGYGAYYLLNANWTPVILPITNPNPDLRWERKEETNIGLDFGILKDRLTSSIDLYKRTTNDLIWDYNVPMPPYLYNTIVANAGVMENKGLEIQLRGIPIQSSNFTWVSSVNFSTNRNKLVSLSTDQFIIQGGYFYTGYIGEPIQETTHRVEEGQEIGNFWTYKSIDIDDDGHWIILGQDGNPKPVADATADDKRVTGNGLPKYFLSWNNTFTYKNLDLEINMRGAFGYQIMNESRIFYETPSNLSRGNILNSALDNVYGKRPLNDFEDYKMLSYYIEDGDYWKIDNVTLGYNINLKSSSFLKQIRVFASGLNLLVITGYKGIDPEVNINGLAPGVDYRDRYPATRSFALGVNINF